MLRELHSFSVIAAFCAMAIMTVETLFAGIGLASILFGGIVLPFAYILAFILGFPLLFLQKKLHLSIYSWLVVYGAVGLLGSTLFLVVMGISITNAFGSSSGFFLTYGPMGLAASTGAWYFAVYRKSKSGAENAHT
ncbi:hypothetical protein [Halioxenophilus sp. WMMB6]|uniref:hypothetical protein n=1 Tax=Halioxenophilus sp. WMMB6 TaxID=3073815 RepID=UPI00295EAAF9|nr:hypothetical protein [Halioxenophilus sp. WMMB6]